MSATFVMGDLHGQLEKASGHLRQAGLLDEAGNWCGGEATLAFLGDYCDRGPDGLGCIELVMRLQEQAPASGGRVIALIGNHEVLLLGAHRFGNRELRGIYEPFWQAWKRNGGVDHDLAGLTATHVDWLCSLPAMQWLGARLLVHADAMFYTNLGASPEAVTQRIRQILAGDEAEAWESLLVAFSERFAFCGEFGYGENFTGLFLTTFGASQLLHGHTPIQYMRRISPLLVTEALVYATGRCINVDGGMYMGGPGFLHQLADEVGA
jgi:hypothetical protein